jgi:hypothetical protein
MGMSLARKQKTCATCGKELTEEDEVRIEPLIDSNVRCVVVHSEHSTFVYPKEKNNRFDSA